MLDDKDEFEKSTFTIQELDRLIDRLTYMMPTYTGEKHHIATRMLETLKDLKRGIEGIY